MCDRHLFFFFSGLLNSHNAENNNNEINSSCSHDTFVMGWWSDARIISSIWETSALIPFMNQPLSFSLGKPSTIKHGQTHCVKAPLHFPLKFSLKSPRPTWPQSPPRPTHTHTEFLCLCFIACWYCVINQQRILTLRFCPAASAPKRTSSPLQTDHNTPLWDISQPASCTPTPPRTHTGCLVCLLQWIYDFGDLAQETKKASC